MCRQFCLTNVPTLLKYTENCTLKYTLIYEMYRKFGPKLVPIFMVYIQNDLIKKYTIFLKIYRIVTAKMLFTLNNVHETEGIYTNRHSSEMYRKSNVKLHSSIKQCCITAPFHTKYATLLHKEQ